MEQIIEQLIAMNRKDFFDIVGVLLPILLTIIIIVQNFIFFARSEKLQKEISNRDERNRYHMDILRIYNLYNEFCDCIFISGFFHNVRRGNCNMAIVWMDNLINLRQKIGRTKELAKLIFKRNNPELYDVLDERCNLAIQIIEKYMFYVSSGELYEVSENAWNTVCEMNEINKYNYQWLSQSKNRYDNFMKLCESDSIKAIENLLKEYEEKHSYDNFDKYFEKYISLNELK